MCDTKTVLLCVESTPHPTECVPLAPLCHPLWLPQHPDKDSASGGQQQQLRARVRDYRRPQDESVILVLVKAADDLSLADDTKPDAVEGQQQQPGSSADGASQDQQQQQQQAKQAKGGQTAAARGKRAALGGDYDGPEAPDLVVSGIPKLPPNTIAPPSPRLLEQQQQQVGGWGRQGPDGADGQGGQQQQGLMQQGSGGMGQQQQQQQGLMHRRSSNASAGLAGLADEEGDDQEQGGGAAVNSSQQGGCASVCGCVCGGVQTE